ncbi:peptidase-C39 like family protein [Candidatus Sumerlaeota bacterium]|nr:peptidase-C39 like family protein [Candidatus Sumerlaeota bacterium]
MESKLELAILPQPTESTCGPTCLHAVYNFYGDSLDLDSLVGEVSQLEEGGTMAVMLGVHALQRGYKATIYTYNLHVFDPSWFRSRDEDIPAKLREQLKVKRRRRLDFATHGYLEFFNLGGVLKFEDLTPKLIRKYLNERKPIITGLSATYLYHDMRELPNCEYDDLRGEPAGHFVLLSGYHKENRTVSVADPLAPNPVRGVEQYYEVGIERVIGAIFLGILTYDANLLIIEPHEEGEHS